MKLPTLLFSLLILIQLTWCQRDMDAYKQNYGLYNNPYDFPSYDISKNTKGYSVSEENIVQKALGLEIPLLAKGDSSLHGILIRDLVVDIVCETKERLHVKIYDKDEKQVAVPDSPLGMKRPNLQPQGGCRKDHNNYYKFEYKSDPFSFQVIRVSDGDILFDTTGLPLVFEDQYLEISTHLPSNGTNIYGFGEVLAPFKRTRNVTTLFARDAHDPYQNMYGTQPFYMDIRNENGAAHGVFLLNAHGMNIVTTEDRITYKAIGGILDFYFFVPQDKRPNAVVQAYTSLVGKPMMPAHWMLGYQNCRYNYTDMEHVEQVVREHDKHGIPLEVQWVDIDYMDKRKDFTFDPVHFPKEKMISFSQSLHEKGQKLVVMVDPAIAVQDSYSAYTRGQELDIFVKSIDGTEYRGQVWPGYTVFPDWWHPNITEYWQQEIVNWMKLLELDGIWIDMNEPSSFCLGSCGSLNETVEPMSEPWRNTKEEQLRLHQLQESALNDLGQPDTRNLLYPDYIINNGAGNLSEKTMAMTAQHYGNISHYDLHNLYGHAEGYITRQAILEYNSSTRPFLLSRSTFAGSGNYMGHWTGDIISSWEDMKGTIPAIFNFQMFGISYSGADICGFVGDVTENLCTRWMELGSFYPFARNHNSDASKSQEAYLWESTAEASRKALRVRYQLLPYFYTLFEESHRLGTGVWRPLVFEFPEYVGLFANNDVQIMLGSDILISPVLTQDAITVDAQFPPGIWYDWYTFQALNVTESNSVIRLEAPLTHIPVHIRGGAILISKSPDELLVEKTFETAYHIIVALDINRQASGRLYVDEGYSAHPTHTSNINFIFTGDKLTVNGQFGYQTERIGKITILSHDSTYKYASATLGDKQWKMMTQGMISTLVISEDNPILLDKGFSIQFSEEVSPSISFSVTKLPEIDQQHNSQMTSCKTLGSILFSLLIAFLLSYYLK